MMDDLTVSEKRLLAALKRLDDAIEHGMAQGVQKPDGAAGELELAHQRLADAGQEIAQLAAANDALTKANRQLLDRLEEGGEVSDDVRLALEAELSALHAARAAEEAQVLDILARLDRVADHLTQDENDSGGATDDEKG